MRTIKIKGWADQIKLEDELSDNYQLQSSFCFEEESTEVIKNVFIRIYESEEKNTLEQAVSGFVKKMFGDLTLTGQEYGYSEYTVEGFNVNSFEFGGHDLDKILKSIGHKYVWILIDQVNPTNPS